MNTTTSTTDGRDMVGIGIICVSCLPQGSGVCGELGRYSCSPGNDIGIASQPAAGVKQL